MVSNVLVLVPFGIHYTGRIRNRRLAGTIRISSFNIQQFLGVVEVRSYPAPFARRVIEAAKAMQNEPSRWCLLEPLLKCSV